MKNALAALAVALLLITAGCIGGEGQAATPESEPTPEVVTDTSATTTPTSDNDSTPTATETEGEITPVPITDGAEVFQSNKELKGSISGLDSDGDTLMVYYGDIEKRGMVELAGVNAPELSQSEFDFETFHYEDGVPEDDANWHLAYMSDQSVKLAEDELGGPGGDSATFSYTGETTADGVPLVYVKYTNRLGEDRLYNAYVVEQGLAVADSPSEEYADSITNAQQWAEENNEGLWEKNEQSEY